MEKPAIEVLLGSADQGGCAAYRMLFPQLVLQSREKNRYRFTSTQRYIVDQNFYKNLNIIRLQRQCADFQVRFLKDFLRPLSNAYGFWTMYEIDDLIIYDELPMYNNAREAFSDKFELIKEAMTIMDVVTTTTDTLAQTYATRFNLPIEKFVVIPNYLPKWWIGDSYNLDRIKQVYRDRRGRPTIGITCSISHYDIDNKNGYKDDFTGIIDLVKSTVKKYDWVFVGAVPKLLEQEARDRKIRVVPPLDIMNYPQGIAGHFNFIVAPLENNLFNRCKSNIKLLESWSLGIPVIAQDNDCYTPYTNMTFDTAYKIQDTIDDLMRYEKKFLETVRRNRDFIENGDKTVKYFEKGAWLENNLDKWNILYQTQKKSQTVKINIPE